MPKFKLRIASADSNDLSRYDELCSIAKRAGFQAIGCGALAENTTEQKVDPNDPWLSFSVINAGIFKVVETSLVNRVFSKSHIEKNAALVAEKSKILARHGLKGVSHFLEPQWLPEWFYAKHPHLRGARCDNPCLSLSNYYAPCVDQPEVLAHYREAVRKLVELAPEIGCLSFWSNDSGGGICWCTGLYPGPNGPRFCKDRPMGRRVADWMKACLTGAADAGREIEMFFAPVHFGRDEKNDTLEHLPRRVHLSLDSGGFPNTPFFTKESLDLIAASKRKKRPAVVGIDPAVTGWLMSPVVRPPLPYLGYDVLREAAGVGAEMVAASGVQSSELGVDAVSTMMLVDGLSRPPKFNIDADKAVMKIARAQVGSRLAVPLESAWRDVDTAFRIWPHNADTNHMLYPIYSLIGGRWLIRPIVPAPRLLAPDEKAYYERGRQASGDPSIRDSFFVSEGQMNYKLDEFKWLVTLQEEMMEYANRALRTLEEAHAGDLPQSPERERFILQYRRVRALRAVWRSMKNVYLCGSIIEYFAGPRKEEFWNVIRRDESFKLPATYRRLFLEGVDDEIENSREIIGLILEPGVPVIAMAEEESAYSYGRDLPDLLEKRIAIMDAHKRDIDVLFPNCPPETFTDPAYDWADKRRGQDAALRESQPLGPGRLRE